MTDSKIDLPDLTPEQWQGLAQMASAVSEAFGEVFAGEDAPTAAELRQYLLMMRKLMQVTGALQQFLATDLAGELTDTAIKASAFSREQELPAALGDALITVSHLHRNGSFKRIRELSDYVCSLDAGLEGDQLIAALVKRARQSPLSQASAMTRTLEETLEGVEQGPDLGGMRGLFKLLQDEEVQQGLRTLASLPSKMQANNTERPA